MRADRAFLDTNVLVYAFGADDPRKPIAEQLIVRGGVIAVQTLNEFVNVERGRLKRAWPDVLYRLDVIESCFPPPIPMTHTIHYRALEIAQRYGYHVYDSMMLAAAIEASCTVFYTEDMHDGHSVDGLKIRNPFV
jgi:predicted nucleic acid-binding protein